MRSRTVVTNSGMSPLTVLFLIFLTLKLCKVIDWSWWLVTAPLWAVPAALLVFAAAMFLVSLLVSSLRLLAKKFGSEKKRKF